MFTSEKLKKYMKFFNDESICFYEYRNGYVYYHEMVDEFINDFYNSNMADTEYNNNLNSYIEKGIPLSNLIKTADIALIKSILTCYIRGERFYEGMIAKGIEEKIFSIALKRLTEYKD